MSNLINKVSLVTGGSRGIGRAIAEHFAEEGAHVALCARNEEQVREAVKALEKKGVKAYGVFPALLPADVVASMHGDGEHVSLASVREASQIFFEALRDTLGR